MTPPARVLIVDDDLGPRESLRVLLKPLYETRTAEDGRTALAEVVAFRPDVILLDFRMPGLTGLDVLERVRQIDPQIAVILITAYASLETVRRARALGAVACLNKPFSTVELRDVIQQALRSRAAAP
jgi:CheY-like chemotaxis protein